MARRRKTVMLCNIKVPGNALSSSARHAKQSSQPQVQKEAPLTMPNGISKTSNTQDQVPIPLPGQVSEATLARPLITPKSKIPIEPSEFREVYEQDPPDAPRTYHEKALAAISAAAKHIKLEDYVPGPDNWDISPYKYRTTPLPPLPPRSTSNSSLISNGSSIATAATALSLYKEAVLSAASSSNAAGLSGHASARSISPNNQDIRSEIPKATLLRPKTTEGMLSADPTITGNIGILPPELLEMVFDNLCWSASIHLAATNKYYRSIVDPTIFGVNKGEKSLFLLSQEQKEKFNGTKSGKDWFACIGCWTLKPQKRFQNEQVHASIHKKGSILWFHRRCLDCEIRVNRYKHGQRIENAVGKPMRLCSGCDEFRTGFYCMNCFLCMSCSGGLDGICPRCIWRMVRPSDRFMINGKLIV